MSRQTLEWLLEMVETPRNRVKAADFAASQFMQYLQKASQKGRERLARLQKRRELARLRLFPSQEPNAAPSATWMRAKGRRRKIESVQRDFLEYARLRLFEINLENAVYVLGAVQEQLNHFNSDLAQCRRKLAEFPNLFPGPSHNERSGQEESAPAPHVTELLPGQSPNLAAAAALLRSLSPELLRQFDENFQAEVLDQQGGLWGLVCEEQDPLRDTWRRVPSVRSFWDISSDAQDVNEALRRELHGRARRVIAKALEGQDAASLLLEAHTDAEARRQALLTQVEAALPRLDVPCVSYQVILLLPMSEAGNTLRTTAQEALAGVPITLLESEGDVQVYQETAGLSLEAACRALAGNETDSVELSRRVLTRTDIPWPPLLASQEADAGAFDRSAAVS